MATPERSNGNSGNGKRWLIILMLFLIQVINYADKSVAGLAAKSIMAELHLSPAQYGLVASSFFSLYALGGLFVAFLVAPRVRARHILTALLVVWSLAQFPIAIAASLTTLILCRTLLGFSEGAGTPTGLNVSHEWFSDKERNLPTALVMLGSTAGSLIAAPVLSYIITLFGWRAAFLACGLAGFVVMLLWVSIARDNSGAAESSRPASNSSNAIKWWRDESLIGIFLVGFCAYWIVGFMVAWLPPFVTMVLGFDAITAGWLLSAVFGSHAVLLLAISGVSQWMMKRGHSSRTARAGIMACCLGGSAVAFMGAAVMTDPTARLVLMALGTGLPPLIFPLGASLVSEVAPETVRHKAMTVIFSAFTVSAIISPWLTGQVVEGGVAGWSVALLVHGGVALAGAVAAFVMLHPERSRARLASDEVSDAQYAGVALGAAGSAH